MERSNVVSMDDYRAIEDVVKRKLGARNIIFSAEMESGEILTYLPHDLLDITLVYMIQTFKDRRDARVNDINS